MRILVYPATMEIGGSTLNALELAARVQERGHEVIVYGRDDVLVGVAESMGLEHVTAHTRGSWPSFADVARLHRLIRRRRVQVVHAYEGGPALDLAALSSVTSRIVPITTVMSMVVPYELPRHSDMFVGTPLLREQAATTRARVHLMEPPIDTEVNRSVDPVAARARWGIDDDSICISMVCRLSDDLGKFPGVVAAVRVVDDLAATDPVQLLVVGGGEGLESLRSLAADVNTRHGRSVVVVTGAVLDPRDAYDATDIALGMGSSALKAMSFAKPLVVQGDHGFWRLFDHGSASDFAHTGMFGDGGGGEADLRTILVGLLAAREEWAHLGRLGREVVERRFSLDAATESLLEVYAQALRTPHPRTVVWRETAYTAKELAKFRVATWDQKHWGGRMRTTLHTLRPAATS